jgi:hypothetical protein
MHINLWTPEQVEDYQYARDITGITNDNDLVRFLFRRFHLHGTATRTLVNSAVQYETEEA